jgi:STE24 endopeptidase
MVFLIPLVIQPLFNKLSPLQPGELRDRIEALARRMKFPLKHLYEIDGSKRSSHSNAYFFGLPWSKHIVIFDTLIKQAKPEEVEAVLAHELGHWYYYHPTKSLLMSQVHTSRCHRMLPSFPSLTAAPFVVRLPIERSSTPSCHRRIPALSVGHWAIGHSCSVWHARGFAEV